MADLGSRYLGLDLRSPLVASSSPLTGSLDGLRRLEAAGAAAVVLPSLFEEQLTLEAEQIRQAPGYLALVEKAKATLRSPSSPASTASPRASGWSTPPCWRRPAPTPSS